MKDCHLQIFRVTYYLQIYLGRSEISPNSEKAVKPKGPKKICQRLDECSNNLYFFLIYLFINLCKMYFELSYDTVHSYNTNQLLINLSFIYLLSEIGCTQPKNPDNAKLNCFGSFCTIQCDPNKKLFKMAFYVSCSTTTLTWDEIPDCVGKLPISFFC